MKHILMSMVLVMLSCGLSARDATRYPRADLSFAANIKHHYRARLNQFLPLSMQVGMDSAFSHEQKELIDRALKILIERITAPHVVDCAFRQAYRGMPKSKEIFVSELYNALRPIAIDEVFMPSFSFISAYSNDPLTVGLGYVSLFYDTDVPLPGYEFRHYLYIALNKDHMGSESNYMFRSDAEYWAGVIAHEFLHNLGYDHPTNSSGYFIKEFGLCLASNGTRENGVEGLEDKSIYKPLDD